VSTCFERSLAHCVKLAAWLTHGTWKTHSKKTHSEGCSQLILERKTKVNGNVINIHNQNDSTTLDLFVELHAAPRRTAKITAAAAAAISSTSTTEIAAATAEGSSTVIVAARVGWATTADGKVGGVGGERCAAAGGCCCCFRSIQAAHHLVKDRRVVGELYTSRSKAKAAVGIAEEVVVPVSSVGVEVPGRDAALAASILLCRGQHHAAAGTSHNQCKGYHWPHKDGNVFEWIVATRRLGVAAKTKIAASTKEAVRESFADAQAGTIVEKVVGLAPGASLVHAAVARVQRRRLQRRFGSRTLWK